VEIRYSDIDWNRLWQNARQDKSWKSKTAGDWDRRAASFAQRTAGSVYADTFIDLLQPSSSWSVLDVGSGPGTIAIPLAKRVERITALDFSPAMLSILDQKAREEGITNITTCNLSWNDDWQRHGIVPHDVVLASRSLSVPDLRDALERLTRYAKKTAVVTDRVGHGPFDPDAFKAVGRVLDTGPDYIYTINLLYQMGIRAKVDFINLDNSSTHATLDEALESYTWMFHRLTAAEKKRLKKYVQSITTSAHNGTVALNRKDITTWAFISWKP